MRYDQIVFLDGNVPSIYFPSGKPENGGTCAYATDECLESCPSCLVTNDHEQRALNYFKEQDENVIALKIAAEVREMRSNLLQWHAWGDCLPELTNKTVNIIIQLSNWNLLQYGFTRNVDLWRELPAKVHLRIGLSVDKYADAKNLSKEKLVCYPDIKKNEARLFWNGKMRARCSGWWCYWQNGRVDNSDCMKCYWQGQGCFYRGK